jgi:phage virion morphogenesis protein
MRIEYDKKQLDAVRERLRKQLEILKNTPTLLPQIATLMYKSVMNNFKHQGTDKEKWKPLALSTIMARKKGKKGGGAKILQDTGYLRTSIMPEVSGNEAIVGTNVWYARIHQYGAVIPPRFIKPINKKALHWIDTRTGEDMFSKGHKIGRTKIPARPFLWLRKEYKDRIMNLVANYLRQK